jgi:hypothetical protein
LEKGMGILIITAVTIIVGVVFLSTISDNVFSSTNLVNFSNDPFTADNITCVQVTTGCIDSIQLIKNGSSGTHIASGNYTLCRTSTTGHLDGIKLDGNAADDASYNGKTVNASYWYSHDCMYVADNTSRTLINLLVIFGALAIVFVGVLGFINSKEGIF